MAFANFAEATTDAERTALLARRDAVAEFMEPNAVLALARKCRAALWGKDWPRS